MRKLKILLKDVLFISMLVILNNTNFTGLQAQQFKNYKFEHLIPDETTKDSIEIRLNEVYKSSLEKKDTVLSVKSLISFSSFYRKNLDFNNSFNKIGEAMLLSEEMKDTLLLAKVYEEFGVLNYLFKQDDEVGEAFKKSHIFYKTAFKNDRTSATNLYKSYYNLLLYYQRIQDLNNLEIYLDSCNYVIENISLKNDDLFLNEKGAFLQTYKYNNLNKGIELLNKSKFELESLKGDSSAELEQKSFLIIVYALLANSYWSQNKLELAKGYFEKSLNTFDESGEHIFFISYVYERYALLLSQLGLHKESYANLESAKLISDKYLNARTDRNRGFLVVKNYYKDQLAEKNKELTDKNLLLSEQRQKALRLRIILFVALSIFVIGLLGVWSRQRFLTYKKKEKYSLELLEHKNEELTENTLRLIEREELIKKMKNYIEEHNSGHSSMTFLKSLEHNSANLWEEFNIRFTSLNKDFYERLKLKTPNLSASDLKICALIKLNFSGKEMAYLLGISLGSIHVARHRLRQKMKLDRDVNLTSFINSI